MRPFFVDQLHQSNHDSRKIGRKLNQRFFSVKVRLTPHLGVSMVNILEVVLDSFMLSSAIVM